MGDNLNLAAEVSDQSSQLNIGMEQFLTILFGENPPESAYFVLVALAGDKKPAECRWFPVYRRDDFIRKAKDLVHTKNIYFGVGLQDLALAEIEWRRRYPDKGECISARGYIRTHGYSDTAMAIPGLWFDLDIKGPAHERLNLPPTLEDALAFLAEFPLSPTMLVDTGYGLHAYWLFRELAVFSNEIERAEIKNLVLRFQNTIQARATEKGWNPELTADLARLLRLPGTFNWVLDGPVPVKVIEYHEDRRYNPSDFEQYLIEETYHTSPKKGPNRSAFPPAQIEPIVSGCAWMRHCREDATCLPEPEWYAMLSILGRCENGEQLAHEWSAPYPKYSPEETNKKLEHALEAAGPRTCENIRHNVGDEYCKGCPNWGKISSPIMLGTTFPKQKESSDHESNDAEEKQGPERQSQASRLLELALEEDNIQVFHDDVGVPYARAFVKDHWEILQIKGDHFRRLMSSIFWENEHKALGNDAFRSAQSVIEAKACFEGPKYELHNRVAPYDGAIWYDMADEWWRAIRVDASGWEIIEEPPILFKRYGHQQPQVEPVAGGDPRILLDFINLTDKDQEILLLVYLITAFVPNIAHPIPVVYGPQGSAKTTFLRALRRLIDPSKTEVLSLPKNLEGLIQLLAHHWAAYFDNLTDLPDEVSDVLCRAVTGEGFSKRELFSDDNDIIYSFRRCVGLDGINVVARRADLLDRSILFGLERIPSEKRKPEQEYWAAFEKAKPAILGGIFDTLSKAMSLVPGLNLNRLPRMADFAKWGYAVAEALGIGGPTFIKAYESNMNRQNEEVLENSLVAEALITFIDRHGSWEGTASELLDELGKVAQDLRINTNLRDWPKAANALSRKLNEIKPNLAKTGIHIERCDRGKDRCMVIHKEEKTDDTLGAPYGQSLQGKGNGDDIGARVIPISSRISSQQKSPQHKPFDDIDDKDDICRSLEGLHHKGNESWGDLRRVVI